jgi:ribosomal-protein-alanine N-acetyltransferase
MNFNDYFSSIPHLETDRLILRAFNCEDIKDYIEMIHDPRVQLYLGG